MDLRAGLHRRVREDIGPCGRVLLAAWHSCTHNAFGNFVVATAEHETPQAHSNSISGRLGRGSVSPRPTPAPSHCLI